MYPNKYISVLIGGYIADAQAEKLFYDELAKASNNERAAKVLSSIAMDEEKHHTMLSEIYRRLNGTQAEAMAVQEINVTEDFAENIKNAISSKAANIEKYRPVYYAVSDMQVRNYLFEIITDELKNIALLDMIYAVGR